MRASFVESRTGRHYTRNYDRFVADATTPLIAVVDSECDDGMSGDVVANALKRSGAALARHLDAPAERVKAVLVDALHEAHQLLVRAGHTGGAAVTVAAGSGDGVVVAHVGDCRLYLNEQHGWVRKTSDHTLLEQARIASAIPSDAEARRARLGIVTRTIGLSPRLVVDTHVLAQQGHLDVLLCTRGAWMPLDPEGGAAPLPPLSDVEISGYVLASYLRDGERDNATWIVARS